MGTNIMNPREHIEKIRKEKYWIGAGSTNPVSKDLRMAVKYLSAELYSKDVHFLMELIQNAEDNEYAEGVNPTLEFLVTCRDITKTGAPATLLIFNNENGFSSANIDSICAVGNSTKSGKRKKGYIGEKGIGFKSVFLLTSQPYIFSNGYQIRFSDKPCPECDIAYIVPEWVDENPTVSDIEQIYGGSIPTTAIILPLKADKVHSVKGQLSTLHPEMLLFLSKIRRLTVKEDKGNNTGLSSVQSVSISSEKDFIRKSSMDAESFTLHLAIDEDSSSKVCTGETECSYFMWRQRFPVKKENQVERRAEVDEWTITLAFPCGERLSRGMTCAGIYAFLPTEMVTNLPFIIQADFLLQSSREAILMDDVWNQGILDCVPAAFVNAFTSLVKTVEGAPSSSLASMFSFLPIKESSFAKLNVIRETIKNRVLLENIMPSEDFISNQRFFYKPSEVSRLDPSFWSILHKAKYQGMKLHSLSSHGRYILSSSFDKVEYNDMLNFLSIDYVDCDWYSKCIRSSDMVLGVNEETYFDLLKFVAGNWTLFHITRMKEVQLLKHIGTDGKLSLFSLVDVNVSGGPKLCRSADSTYSDWLISCSREFNSAANLFFLPQETQRMLSRSEIVQSWLKDKCCMDTLTVYEFAKLLCSRVRFNGKLALAFAQLMYHSYAKRWLVQSDINGLCGLMPLVDSYGACISSTTRSTVLVPANGSKWIELLGSNPWKSYGYIELWEKYTASGTFCGEFTPAGKLISFFTDFKIAKDLPDIHPPNSALPSVYSPLRKENVFLLLRWIKKLNSLPCNFLQSIKSGSWIRVLMSGSASYQPPSQAFLSSTSGDALLQKCCVNVDMPIIDEEYYDKKIGKYMKELRFIGVRSGCQDVCEFIGNHLTSLANHSSFTKKQLLAILIMIQYLGQQGMSPKKLISSAKQGLVRTSQGDKSTNGCVLYDEEWKSASLVCNIPFIDKRYYGDDILQYKTELKLLGVVVGTDSQYQIAGDLLKTYTSLANLSAEAFFFLLKCVQSGASSSLKVIDSLKAAKCLRTANRRYLSPGGCFLPDAETGQFLSVFDCFSVIDINFYSPTIFFYKPELEKLGVFVHSEDATREFLKVFKQKVNSLSLAKHHVLSTLACLKKVNAISGEQIIKEVSGVKWFCTRLGDFRSPSGCILFGSDWEFVTRFTMLPFIDDSDSGYGSGIHDFKAELKRMGVVTDIEKNHGFVIEHLSIKIEMGPSDMLSLLGCIKKVLPDAGLKLFPASFTKEISKKWVKTSFGYRSPEESILFSATPSSFKKQTKKWADFFQCSDGPFIDEQYYGCAISSYVKELKAIGVIVDLADGATLIAKHLKSFCDFDSIKRVYHYLDHVNWKPEEGATAAGSHVIWVPTADLGRENTADGSWVSASDCVLHDADGMFCSRLIVLEVKGFDRKLLSFFSRAFRVKSHPSFNDYCQLWKEWESSDLKPSHAHCCSFWAYVVNHWNSKIVESLSKYLTKVPCLSVDSGEIVLVEKNEVFIPDDLLLKDLFSKSTALPLFVWTPRPSHPSIPYSKLFEIYRAIGVKTLSESAVKVDSSIPTRDNDTMRPTKLDNVFLRRGMFMLVLGFLSSDELGMDSNRRHEIVKSLTQVTAYETVEPIRVCYSLPVSVSSEGNNVNVKASRMVRWEKEKSEFFAQKLDLSVVRQKDIVEYAKNFSQVVSQGLLWKMEEHIPRLEKLLTVGFCVHYDEEAVAYYMKAENLQVFMEDEEFLASVLKSSSSS